MTIEEQIADNTLRAADALTVGKEGVKYDGDVITLLREHTAALTEQTAILRELRDLAKAALGPKPTAGPPLPLSNTRPQSPTPKPHPKARPQVTAKAAK